MIAASRWAQALHGLDYSLLLPILARLPLPLAYRLASIRGHMNAWLKKDWRSMALARQGLSQHIARRTAESYRQMFPEISERELARLVHERFHTEAMEEFEGALIYNRRVDELECEFIDLPKREPGRGLLLITAHYGSFVLGYCFLARLGWKINVLATDMVLGPEIPASIRRYFQLKYSRLQERFNGGQLIYYEQGLKPALQTLFRGESLGIQADSPPQGNDNKLAMPFVGEVRRLASGGIRCAVRTDAQVCAYLCERVGIGRYRLRFSALGDAHDRNAIESAYQFLSWAIQHNPAQWCAADLLPAMPIVDEK